MIVPSRNRIRSPWLRMGRGPEDGGGGVGAQHARRSLYHLHINHFAACLPAILSELQMAEGFSVTKCTIKESNSYTPLWIATKKVSGPQDAEHTFESVRSRLSNDPAFYGYIECETIEKRWVRRFTQTTYNSSSNLGPWEPTFVQALRGADVHIFRAIHTPYDDLDEQLERAGFYEVLTDKERIWTFLMEDVSESLLAFDFLQSHFATAGGISKIEREIVRSLSTVPKSFPLRMVAASGLFGSH